MGVGLGVCAWHEFIQKNGAVDLQKGERYANMDYAYASLLRHHDPKLTKVTSYDIACQWYKKVISRVKALPLLVCCDLFKQDICFVIPKLHIHGHQLACQLKFSLNWLRGAGRTDGEGIERPWAHLGPIATSTCDMGPGARHGMMNNHFGHWNWGKLTGLGTLLHKRLKTANDQFRVHKESLDEFTAGRGTIMETWEQMIRSWEEQQEKPEEEREEAANPYEMPQSGMSEADVRLKLTEEEAVQAKEGTFSLHNVGPTAFITQLLEVEAQQRLLKMGVEVKSFETVLQKTQLAEKRTKIMLIRRFFG
ncbi:hypothetical protein BT96DRAFT_1010262 [Gymnopus androsaceus JB14]|uniref:Uncharacterized protein n=1 Tax=Gymnopus androsaceus JB14 TaxID=1447944 RepID=A0A6A4GB03_9AGAR|nr:hypothetical protein BT96DRAFT_1010262 [Gymnopus androsaceus JB14]